MPLVNTSRMLSKAAEHGYAVGSFNFTNFEQAQTILDIVKEKNCPAILAVSASAIKYMGPSVVMAVIKELTAEIKQEVALHLDHGKDFDICKKAIDVGFTSVMIDASDLNFEDNVRVVSSVVNYAKKHNVTVEAELGQLKGVEDNINVKKTSYTNKNEVRSFVERTKIDSLAISIGTSHGAYKFKGKPTLDISLLKEIKTLIPQTPLVLHGASSVSEQLRNEFRLYGGIIGNAQGVNKELLKLAIINGISKVNVDTDLRISFTTGIRKNLKYNKKDFNLRNYLGSGKKYMKDELEKKLIIFGCSNKSK